MFAEIISAIKKPLVDGLLLAGMILLIALLFAGALWCFNYFFFETKKVVGQNRFLQLTIYPLIAIIVILLFYVIMNKRW